MRWSSGRSNPQILPSAGRTKFSKETNVDTGFPGKPKTSFSPLRAKTVGFPGFMATLVKRI